MSDDADTAADLQAAANEAAAAYRKPELRLDPVGWCHECGEDLAGLARFCDAKCSDAYERREAQRR